MKFIKKLGSHYTFLTNESVKQIVNNLSNY